MKKKDDGLTDCARSCLKDGRTCKEKECRKWIDHREDLNCCLISIRNSGGPMTLMETGKRLGLSFVRIRQIEKRALEKLSKRL